mmetsp:Transcript_14779/g.25144  ORF Transcript_14779/g.25144 Transcript_14779/m.25144 type:complete len:432 (-) Transcript_14779:50-1345(-)
MNNKPADLADYDDLLEYNDNNVIPQKAAANGGENSKKILDYTGVHSTGFKEFLLKSELNRAIKQSGFEHPSEVQQQCIPQAIEGKDIICQARAGMGKTAVFIIAILNQIEQETAKSGYAIILGNVRELANQIKNEFDRFTEFMPWVRKHAFLGGQPIQEHIKILKNPEKAPHIIIGTPGRVIELIKLGHIKGENNKIFVLDECDKLIDETDMREQVQKIFIKCASEKQVLMFSATFPEHTKQVCKKFMKDPFELFIDSDSKLVLHGLKQYFVKLEENQKIRKLIQLLDDLDFNQVIVFTKNQQYAQKLNEIIQQEKFPSVVCTGNMKTDQRLKVYQEFKDGKYRVMVSTDVLGRGIDIEKINVVFNYDMPKEVNQYMHRVGRAGRFGTKGLAISFISSEEDTKILEDIQSQFEVKIEDLPSSIDKATYMNN